MTPHPCVPQQYPRFVLPLRPLPLHTNKGAHRMGRKRTGTEIVDRIGPWSEVKHELLRKYAAAYAVILQAHRLKYYYVDAFCGAGFAFRKGTEELVKGSPLHALEVRPAFKRYFFIDLDGDKVELLREQVGDRPDVVIRHGDANAVLLEEVLPSIRYDRYERGLCVLDPYALHLNWEVVESAGKSGVIDLILNFPIMDMNRNALWSNPSRVTTSQAARMTAFWGDESWREAAYEESPQFDLFGSPSVAKVSNEAVVEAYRKRLKTVAGFQHVSRGMPIRMHSNAPVYYLVHASQVQVAVKIANEIFNKFLRDGA